MALNRETIYQALFALASTATQAVTKSRSLRTLDEVATANMPALYQHQVTESRSQDKGQPFILTMKVDLYFYAAMQNPNIQADADGYSASSQLNSMLDNLDAALTPDPITMVQTLGGLVSHCWIAGNTTYFEDTQSQKAALVVGVEMLVQQDSADGYAFDSGSIYMIDKRAGADATPQLVGGMNEINMTVKFENNVERGTFQHDFKAMRKAQSIKGVAKFAQIKGAVLAQMLYGQPLVSGSENVAVGINYTIPATGPYTVTPTGLGTFSLDLGCILDATAQVMTLVTGTPTTGQYKISGGTYTFAAADAGKVVSISYRYTVTTGVKMTLSNVRSELVPEFLVVLNVDGNGKNTTWTLNSCYSDQLAFVTKLEDFTVPEFSFTAKADGSNVIGTFSYSQ